MAFESLRTTRLLIRSMVSADATALAERRNDPAVARYQNWLLPFPIEQAGEITASSAAMDGPMDGEWWMAIVADRATGETLGDVAIRLSWGGRAAEIGYTLASEHWGNGYATEAVGALLGHLFEKRGVTRVEAKLHPDNVRSALVAERTGFRFEGRTKLSYWVGDDNTDDVIYGLVRTDWETWRDRLRHQPTDVGLVEIDHTNFERVAKLEVSKTQEEFVAPMLWSYADALFSEEVNGALAVPWYRAVRADDEYVGFVMLSQITEHHPEPFLWRLLVDRLHQRRSIGKRVVALAADQCRTWGATTMLTSWGTGPGSPEPFYTKLGFVPTGRIIDDEVEARLQLDAASSHIDS